MTARSNLCLGLSAWAVAACGPSAPPHAEAIVRDSAGVRIVRSGPATDAPVVRLGRRPVFRTGWEDDEPTFEFLLAGALRADGTALVFDDGGKILYDISADGAEWTEIGRRGDGPGEFQSGEAVELLSGDTILVYDYMLGRITLFDPKREYVRSARWTNMGVVQSRIGGVTASGRLAWVPSSFSASRDGGPNGWLYGPLVTSATLGGDVDTVASVPMVDLGPDSGPSVRDPFARFSPVDGYRGGFVWGRNDVAEVRWVSEAGTLQQLARWEADPEEVDGEVWSRYEAAFRQRLGSSPEGGARERLEQRMREARLAASDHLPLFRFLTAAPDGTAWVGAYTFSGAPARSYLVFGAGGALEATVEFPRPIRILDISGDRVLGVERDEWDVQAVAVYRVER